MYKKLLATQKYVRNICISPRSETIDARRQEYILNVLLTGLVPVAVIACLVSGLNLLSPNVVHNPSSFISNIVVAAILITLLVVSRRGHPRVAAICFISLVSLIALQLTISWSFELQEALLVGALLITIAGVLFPARVGLGFGLGLSVVLLIIGYLQVHKILVPDLSWTRDPEYFSDAVGFAGTFSIIALIAWLSNREIDNALTRARRSEKALARERDNLEIKVAKRTRELEETQVARLIELSRFAEFGRLSANLLHEVANPLTAASLNLEQIGNGKRSELVVHARENLQRLERYVVAARKQIRGEGDVSEYSIRDEIEQIRQSLDPSCEKSGITISVQAPARLKQYGDAVKFSQLVRNLLSNAIEAYADTRRKKGVKEVLLSVKQQATSIELQITDWGSGIKPGTMTQIFNPFFSTKRHSDTNMGIGLAMVKQFVEVDFKGTISVTSSKEAGTTFTVTMPIQKAPRS